MLVGDISELKIAGVYDRGVPNLERIVLMTYEQLNIGQYGLMLGIRQQGRQVLPIGDNLYWFGDGVVSKGDWVNIYTGPGEHRAADVPNSTQKIYTVHWGRRETILNSPEVVPILFRVNAVDVHFDMHALPVGTEQKQLWD